MKQVHSFGFKQFMMLFILLAFAVIGAKIFSGLVKTNDVKPFPVYGKVVSFSLLNQSSQQMTRSDLDGKVWVANFIFTRCAGVCPLMSAKMKKVHDSLASEEGVRFVSFSVDPEYDKPEILEKYAQKYKADPKKWFFLTGKKSEIYKLSEQHFYLGVSEVPEEDRESVDQMIRHSSKFALVDQSGRIRGYYQSDEKAAMDQLVQDVRELL